MSRQEDFDTQSDKYVEMRKSFGVNDPYALKEIGEAHYQGSEHGYQYALTHPHWIPVEERLPKRMSEKSRFSETVLVYNKEGFNDTAYYDYEEKIWRWLPGVTHWMPIVPPKKEE